MITMNVSNTFGRLARCGIDRSCTCSDFRIGVVGFSAHAVTIRLSRRQSFNLHPCRDQGGCSKLGALVHMLAICLVIFLAVFGVMFYSIWKHRKSVGYKSVSRVNRG
jgi:cytochrome c oxidase subunit 2